MLREIQFIQSIGRFETAKPTQGAICGLCTLVFGENGWGKSTLADVLRSLTTNNPAILAGRRTLASNAPPRAVLRFSTQKAFFDKGAWTGARPRIAIYDSAFINDNVFSGDLVSADHLKNQYGLVVGEEGVQLVRRIVELDGGNREANKVIADAEAELKAVIRTIGVSGMQPAGFLALEARADIDEAIAAKDNHVQRVRRSKELKGAVEPSLLPVPTEPARLRSLLSQSIDDIAEAALASVRAHIAKHPCKPVEGGLAHESWLEAGMTFIQGDACPFCGQRLADRALVNAYKVFFSAAYKSLGASVRRARETLGRYRSGDFRRVVAALAEQNAVHFRYWCEAGKLDLPDIRDSEAIIAQMERAAVRLDTLFGGKQANLTEGVSGSEVDDAMAAWQAGCIEIAAVNARIEGFVSSIRSLKSAIDPAELPGLENELKVLQATKRRHDTDIVVLAKKVDENQTQKGVIAKEKAEMRTALTEHGRTITTQLGAAINEYLRRLGAGFRIDYREPDYRGKEPAASYSIVIREVAVAPRSGELDKPSFRNTLSAGDKSTLALALFLAKVNADPMLKETIVVLDDPFTSLDHGRRQFTAIEIKKLCDRAQQVFVLSHEKAFLRLLWDKIDRALISSLALQTGAPGVTTIAPYDIAAATQPRHITERTQIEEFFQGEAYEPTYIRTRLRTVCEDFYRKGDPGLFGQAASFEEIIRVLERAPDTHPYKGALEDLRDINEYSRGDSHAAVPGNPAEETSIEELKEFCRLVLDLTRGM